jgi:HemY protein
MIRAISWIIILGVLVAGAVWFADRPGAVTLDWQGWRIETTVGFLMFGIAFVAVSVAALYRFWLFLRRTPVRLAAYRRASKRERGYRALTEGMVAVAAGDAAEAGRQARRADTLLGDPPLTMLLSAQAAQLNGDDGAARIHFTNMLERPETAFLGLRGLLVQAQHDDDTEAALHYARRAYEMRPKTAWVLPALFDLQVKQGSWVEALASLEEAVRRRAVSQEEGRNRRVIVLLGCSDEAAGTGNMRDAISYARKAYNHSPEFLPATIRLVGLMVEDGKLRPASRIIHNAWARDPHPELARIYAAMAPSEEAIKKVRRFERLLSFNPTHPESHVALAEAALEAELWGSARSHLEAAAETSKTARTCRLMADVEEAEHKDSEAARRWLIEAATANPDPAWLCASCGAASAAWAPVCGHCGELGDVEWRTPMHAGSAGAIPAPDAKALDAPDKTAAPAGASES